MRTPVTLTLLLGALLGAPPALAQEDETAEGAALTSEEAMVAADEETRTNEEIAATQDIEASSAAADQPMPSAPEPKTAEERLSPTDAVVGHFGLGYFTGYAPVGARYWLTRDTAIDVGLDAAFSSGELEAHRYGIELGYVLSLANYHYSVVFARAGLGFRFLDSFGDHSTAARYDLNGSAFVGAELFLGAFGFPNISLQGGYGIEANYTYNGGSAFLIGTVSGGLSVVGTGTLGFHIYL